MSTEMTPRSLVESAPDLVSLPAVVLRISEMLGNDDCSAVEIGEVIRQDPALTARLLKIVNSPYYGLAGRVDTLSRAVSVVGIDVLYTLILTTSVIHGFPRIPSFLVNMTEFWLHSIYCAEIARLLARETSVLHSERLFIAGLLHRVGDLVIYAQLPDRAREVLLASAGDDRLLPGLEQEMIGFTYAEVGAELATSWSLPVALQEALRWQLQPHLAGSYRIEAGLLALSNQLKAVCLLGVSVEEALNEVSEDTLELTGLKEPRILDVLSELPSRLDRTASLLLPDRQAGM